MRSSVCTFLPYRMYMPAGNFYPVLSLQYLRSQKMHCHYVSAVHSSSIIYLAGLRSLGLHIKIVNLAEYRFQWFTLEP